MSASDERTAVHRHFWRPAGDSIRHAFRGRRWEREERATSVCGRDVALGAATEYNWIVAPTCPVCYRILKDEC